MYFCLLFFCFNKWKWRTLKSSCHKPPKLRMDQWTALGMTVSVSLANVINLCKVWKTTLHNVPIQTLDISSTFDYKCAENESLWSKKPQAPWGELRCIIWPTKRSYHRTQFCSGPGTQEWGINGVGLIPIFLLLEVQLWGTRGMTWARLFYPPSKMEVYEKGGVLKSLALNALF